MICRIGIGTAFRRNGRAVALPFLLLGFLSLGLIYEPGLLEIGNRLVSNHLSNVVGPPVGHGAKAAAYLYSSASGIRARITVRPAALSMPSTFPLRWLTSDMMSPM